MSNTTVFSLAQSLLSMDPWTKDRLATPAGILEYFWSSFILNTCIFVVFFGVAYSVAYPGGMHGMNDASVKRWKPFKFNPKYPALSLVRKEAFRSWTSVAIVSVLDALVTAFVASVGDRAAGISLNAGGLPQTGAGWIALLVLAVVYLLFADAHFYWTHRLLHGRCGGGGRREYNSQLTNSNHVLAREPMAVQERAQDSPRVV